MVGASRTNGGGAFGFNVGVGGVACKCVEWHKQGPSGSIGAWGEWIMF